LSENGVFPIGRPMQTADRGYTLHVIGFEATRACADLLANTQRYEPFEPALVQRMLRLFADTRLGDHYWWKSEYESRDRGAWWTSALAVLALGRIIRLLDRTINDRVSRHFSAKEPEQQDLVLGDLLYTDYGVADAAGRASAASDMLTLRSHLEGSASEFWSIILHGPPGTGKTTLLEALAKSSRKRYLAVTPSDILVGGAEHIERRARAVFRALELLTDTVILFDEFDSVIRRRDPRAGTPKDVFEFLTPGMLPKLKDLRVAAKKRRVVFALATNLIGSLDNAAIRGGRFDKKIGIYPPDRVSRVGWLVSGLKGSLKDGADVERLWDCVAATAGAPMNGIPGQRKRLCNYILNTAPFRTAPIPTR
jgi:hypothetical protein